MSNLQPNCCLKFDFQKVDQHAGGKCVIWHIINLYNGVISTRKEKEGQDNATRCIASAKRDPSFRDIIFGAN